MERTDIKFKMNFGVDEKLCSRVRGQGHSFVNMKV